MGRSWCTRTSVSARERLPKAGLVRQVKSVIQILARELEQTEQHVENVVALLDEGNTIPFIARYRKHRPAQEDQRLVPVRLHADLQKLLPLPPVDRQDLMTLQPVYALAEVVVQAVDAEVEDLYRPYKQKRRTRATAAREKGLEPLAALLYAQKPDCPDPLEAAAGYIDPEKGVETAEVRRAVSSMEPWSSLR